MRLGVTFSAAARVGAAAIVSLVKGLAFQSVDSVCKRTRARICMNSR